MQNELQQKRKLPKRLRSELKKPERSLREGNLPPSLNQSEAERLEENNPRFHRLETLVSVHSKRWNRPSCGETLLERVLDLPGKLCYGSRLVVGWFDGSTWQKINFESLKQLQNILQNGKFVKIAMLEEGNPTGEDDDGMERSS